MLNVLRSGFGLITVTLSTPLYTAILLIGLIGITFPEAFTQRASTPFEISGVDVSTRENLSPESSSTPESIVNVVVGLLVQIPTNCPTLYIFVPVNELPAVSAFMT